MNKKALVWRQIVPAVLAVVVILVVFFIVSDAGAQVKEGMKCEGKGGICQDDPCNSNQINLGSLACKEKGQPTKYCCKDVEKKNDTPIVGTTPPKDDEDRYTDTKPPGAGQVDDAERLVAQAQATLDINTFIDAYEQARITVIYDWSSHPEKLSPESMRAWDVILTARPEILGEPDRGQCILYGTVMNQINKAYLIRGPGQMWTENTNDVMENKERFFARYAASISELYECTLLTEYVTVMDFVNVDTFAVDEDKVAPLTETPAFNPTNLELILPSLESRRLPEETHTQS
jgi:hypothetical protein